MHCGVHHTRKTECTHSHTRQGRERQRCGTACGLSSTADAEEGGAAYSVDYKPEATTKMTQWNFLLLLPISQGLWTHSYSPYLESKVPF